VLTGGVALRLYIVHVLRYATALPCSIAYDPRTCVARGTGHALEEIKRLKNVLMTMY